MIEYQLPVSGRISLKIYNVNGQLVDTLVEGFQPAGYHSAVWNAEGRSSGVYFCRIDADQYSEVKRLVLLK